MIQTNKWNLIIKFEWNIRDLICITKKILTLQSNQKSFKSIHNKFPFFNFLQITIHLYLTLYYQTTSILKQFLKQYWSLYKPILHSLRNLYNLSKKRKRKKKTKRSFRNSNSGPEENLKRANLSIIIDRR